MWAQFLPSRPVIIGFLLVFALFFNALLASLNAHVMSVSTAHVVGMEMLTVLAIVLVAIPLREREMLPWVLFAFAFVLIFAWVFLFNALDGRMVSPKPLRDMLLISAFGVLGMCYHKVKGNIITLLIIIAAAVDVFLLMENYFTETYAYLFNIAKYYANTRGFGDEDPYNLNELGLFVTAGGFEGRFTLGFRTAQRLSSLFLEQTSLGSFGAIMAIVTSVFWDKSNNRTRAFFIITVLLALLGTDSRLALGTILLVVLGHLVVTRLPKGMTLFYIPLLLLISAIIFFDPIKYNEMHDNLSGRYGWSLTLLSQIDLQGAFGGAPGKLTSIIFDSGYTYMIYAQTIFGMLLYWVFTSLILSGNDTPSRRFSHFASIFIATNLMVGVTLFSIKTAALLWFVGGYVLRASEARDEQSKLFPCSEGKLSQQ